MGIGLGKGLLSIFLDYTTDGERVIGRKEYETNGNGERHLSKITRVIPETGEVLAEEYYSSGEKKPHTTHVRRGYMLN